jgi:hypothetical protein
MGLSISQLITSWQNKSLKIDNKDAQSNQKRVNKNRRTPKDNEAPENYIRFLKIKITKRYG